MAKFRNPFSIADFSTRLVETILRFPLTVIACFTLMFFVVSDVNDIDMFHCAEAIVISLAVSIGCEGRVKPWLNWVITAAALAIWTLYSIFFPAKEADTGQIFLDFSVGVCFGVAIFTVLFYRRQPDDRQFWNYSRSIIVHGIFSFAFALALMLGLYLAVLFVILLGLPLQFGHIAAFCMFVVFPVFTICYVPRGEERFNNSLIFSKLLKIVTQYLLLPFIALYFVIIYFYLFTILAQWSLPDGKITYIVTASVALYLMLLLLGYPAYAEGESRIFRFLARWGALIALPLVILMSVSICYRINQYGFTIRRGYVVALNLWFYGVLIFLFVTKSLKIKWIPISFAIVFLLVSIGPWSISEISFRQVSHRFLSVCHQAHLFQNGKIDEEKLHSYYISNKLFLDDSAENDECYDIQSQFSYLENNYSASKVESMFASHGRENVTTINFVFHGREIPLDSALTFYRSRSMRVDISGYKYYSSGDDCSLEGGDVLFKTFSGRVFTLPRSVVLKETREKPQELVFKGEDFMIIMQHLTYRMDEKVKKGDYIYCNNDFIVVYQK